MAGTGGARDLIDRRYDSSCQDDRTSFSEDDVHVAPDWLLCAARLPGKSLHIACLLRLLAAFEKPCRIPLSNSIAATIGIDRNAKYRALQWLEDAELIRVQRKMGQPPLVTILNVAEAPDDEN